MTALRNLTIALLTLGLGASALGQVTRSAGVKANRALVYHGKLVRPNGDAPTGSASLTVKVLSPDPSLCVLWSETQTVQLDGGAFSVELGHTVNRLSGVAGGVASDFKQAFVNNPSLTMTSATCASGNSYTPTSTDDRLLSATFNENGNVIEIVGLPIKSVPFALQAEEIAGFGIANLAKISGIGSNLTYTPAEMQTLKDMLGGDIVFDMKSRRVTKVAAPAATDDAATKAYVDTAIAAIPAGGTGSVTSVGLSVPAYMTAGAAVTSSGNISLAFNSQTANRVFASPDGSAGAPSFRALAATDIPALDAAKIATGTFTASHIPTLDASKIGSGVLPAARGGTGIAPTAGDANKFYGVNAAGNSGEFKTITAGANVTINPTASGIEIASTASGAVTSVGVAGLPLSVVNASTSPVISIAQANTTTAGYLSAADWNTFNNKQAALGFTPVSNALATGQVYLGVGGVATASNFGIGQMRNNIGTLQMPTSCTSSQTLTWSAVTDVLVCSNIAVGTSNLANSSVTYAKIQDVSATNRLLGRATAGAGVVEEITLGSNLAYSGTTLNVTGLGGLADNGSVDLSGAEATGILAGARFPALTGAVTTSAGSLATAISANAVQTSHITDLNVTTNKLAANAVTAAKFRQSAGLSVVGNAGTTTADVSDITGSAYQVLRVNAAGTALGFGSIDLSTPAVSGYLPVSNIAAAGAASGNFLRGDGTWSTVPTTAITGLGGLADNNSVDLSGAEATGILAAARFPALTGAITTTAGALATTLSNNSVSSANITDNTIANADLRQGGARSVIGVTGNATANVADIQGTTNQVLRVDSAGTGLSFGAINLASSAAVSGYLPVANMAASGAAAGTFLQGNGTWSSVPISAITGLGGLADNNSVDLSGAEATGILAAARFPALTGDVTTTAGAVSATVAAVGGQTAANVAAGAVLANAATSANTASAIVKRDASGGFTAGEITANPASNNQARFIGGNYGVIHRNDGANYYILLTASADQTGTWNALRPFSISTSTGDVNMGNGAMLVKHGGNVGIGTTSPSQKLDVNGIVETNGLNVGGSAVITSTGYVVPATATSGAACTTTGSLAKDASGALLVCL